MLLASAMFTTLSKHTPVVQGDDLGVQTYISLCQRRHMKKKVAVIGAGPSGLVVAKECQELGHSVTIFEASDRIGGVFGHCYEDAKLTSSSIHTQFGAFVDDRVMKRPVMWTAEEYVDYLGVYAQAHCLYDSMRFHTRVACVTPVDETALEKGFRVSTLVQQDGQPHPQMTEHFFDHVAICSGVHGAAERPRVDGDDTFTGRLMHSIEYTSAAPMRGRRVLIVGLGESGSDIALHAAQVAESVAVCSRSGPGYVVPREVLGSVADLDTNRAYHSLPQSFTAGAATLWHSLKTFIESFYLTPQDDKAVLSLASKLNRDNGSGPFERFGTKNTSFCEAVVHHGALLKPSLLRLEADHAVFSDGSTYPCDLVLFCTGFTPAVPFLKEWDSKLAADMVSPSRPLFKHMLHPRTGLALGLFGFVRPAFGSIPPMAEMQARYYALLISNATALPDPAAMQAEIEEDARVEFATYPHDAPRIAPLTNYLRFQDRMAQLIGCQPPLNLRTLLTDPRLFFRLLCSPLSAVQYRITGPGALPAADARNVVCSQPTMPRPLLFFELFTYFLYKAFGFLL